jgi:hypothetical protein
VANWYLIVKYVDTSVSVANALEQGVHLRQNKNTFSKDWSKECISGKKKLLFLSGTGNGSDSCVNFLSKGST